MKSAFATIAALLVAIFVSSFVGCTKQEKLYRVSGAVTYNGKPIPKGLIFFDPKAGGPQGFANILDGKYDTAKGKGIRGGEYEIRVNGFDGKEAPEAPFGQGLFPEYTGAKELPAADSTYDLDITKSR
jgi:hypothetical protein